MYVFSEAYLVPNTLHLLEVILSLTSMTDENEHVRETVIKDVTESRLKDLYSAA